MDASAHFYPRGRICRVFFMALTGQTGRAPRLLRPEERLFSAGGRCKHHDHQRRREEKAVVAKCWQAINLRKGRDRKNLK